MRKNPQGVRHSNKEAYYLGIGKIWMRNEYGLDRSISTESGRSGTILDMFGKCGTKDLLLLVRERKRL